VLSILPGIRVIVLDRHFGSSTLFVLFPTADIYTGSAEDNVFKLKWNPEDGDITVAKQITLKAKGVSDIAVRRDARLFATAGWDNKIRLFSCKTCAPLAVLQVGFNCTSPGSDYKNAKSGLKLPDV
jgi:WD40 repeat protein